MDMSIKYTNHLGKSMVFGAPDGSLHYFANELRDFMYSFREYGGKAMNYKREGKVVLLKVGIAAQTEDEGEQLREELYRLTTADVEAGKQGKLTIGGFDMSCTVIGQANSVYNYGDRFLECDLSIRIDDPVWRTSTVYPFRKPVEVESTGFLDYPYDYPYDYTPSAKASTVENLSSQQGGSDFLLRAYGPCKNPYVQIAGNSYRVNVTVPPGGFLEVNSAEGTVELVSMYGERTNAYADRQRGASGSGSYIFQRIPSGTSIVSWNNAFDFDLELFDERSIPPWR